MQLIGLITGKSIRVFPGAVKFALLFAFRKGSIFAGSRGMGVVKFRGLTTATVGFFESRSFARLVAISRLANMPAGWTNPEGEWAGAAGCLRWLNDLDPVGNPNFMSASAPGMNGHDGGWAGKEGLKTFREVERG